MLMPEPPEQLSKLMRVLIQIHTVRRDTEDVPQQHADMHSVNSNVLASVLIP